MPSTDYDFHFAQIEWAYASNFEIICAQRDTFTASIHEEETLTYWCNSAAHSHHFVTRVTVNSQRNNGWRLDLASYSEFVRDWHLIEQASAATSINCAGMARSRPSWRALASKVPFLGIWGSPPFSTLTEGDRESCDHQGEIYTNAFIGRSQRSKQQCRMLVTLRPALILRSTSEKISSDGFFGLGLGCLQFRLGCIGERH